MLRAYLRLNVAKKVDAWPGWAQIQNKITDDAIELEIGGEDSDVKRASTSGCWRSSQRLHSLQPHGSRRGMILKDLAEHESIRAAHSTHTKRVRFKAIVSSQPAKRITNFQPKLVRL